MTALSPEVWMRNPRNYIRECVEVGVSRFVWDSGSLRKGNIDPYKFHELYNGIVQPWDAIIIHKENAVHLGTGRSETNPIGGYPVWYYGQPMERLEDLIAHPVGESTRLVNGSKPIDWNPVKGQAHRIVIVNIPPVGTGHGRQFIRLLDEMQEEYPEVTLHLHSLYSYRTMFGLNFKSVDCDPRTIAQKGRVYLPTGKEVYFESTLGEPHWVTLLGMRPVELRIPRNRCIYNIKSMTWAAEHFKDAVKIETRNADHATDPNDPKSKVPTSKSIMVRRIRPSDGDKYLCNVCTLQTACKYFREGAVCIVPGSEPLELAKFFKTRDSDTIIDGLGTLLAAQTHRLEKALETEEVSKELLPETTKIINTLFDRGVKLAKLVNPALAAAGANKFNFNFGDTNNTQINAGTPQALMAAIVEEFVKRGIPRASITPEMVMKVYTSPDDLKQKAIEVAASEKSA